MKTHLTEFLKAKNFLILLLSGCINAFGVSIFLKPVGLYDSGISGTSMLLAQITPEWMTLSAFLVLLNVPLFLYGLKKQGAAFTIYSIFAVCVYAAAAWLITDVLPIDVAFSSPLAGTDLLLCAVFGGLISGIGSGLTLRGGGAIDGVEVMAVIFAKRLSITVGQFVMRYMEAFECGTTKLPAKGGFTNAEKTVIYLVINRFQIGRMKNIVHTIDPAAFLTISEVADVFRSINAANIPETTE